MAEELIHQLRDIHLPPPISIWPLAPGWYYLFGLLLIFLILVGYKWFKKIQQGRLKKIVLFRLAELQKQQHLEQNIAEELSLLLRRCVLARFPRREVAGLHGQEWLQFLDRTAVTTEFTQGTGKLLVVYPYQGNSQPLPEELFHLIKSWVKKNL